MVGEPRDQSPSMAARAVTAVCLVAAAAAFVILARHAAGYFFLFDDFALNGQASRWPLHDLLATPLFGFYRPGEFLWVRGAHAAFGWHTPAGYAAATLLLHAVNAALVGRLARRLAGDATAAWVAGALFALSPWSAEAMFWMSAGFDVLSTSGALVALLAGLAACDPARSRRAGAALVAVCAAGTIVALFTEGESRRPGRPVRGGGHGLGRGAPCILGARRRYLRRHAGPDRRLPRCAPRRPVVAVGRRLRRLVCPDGAGGISPATPAACSGRRSSGPRRTTLRFTPSA